MSMADSKIGTGLDMDVFTYADLIVKYLEQLGIEYVFGVPGGAIEPLYNAMAKGKTSDGVKSVVARHESGAAFMADGYARETGKIGVCCATTGPGATNLITGVSAAYADNIPLLVITAQTPLPKFGKRALQDSSCAAIDTVGMFNHCTKYSTLVSHHEQLETKLVSAIMTARNEPAGPVHVSIPSDVLRTAAAQGAGIESRTLKGRYTLTDQGAMDQMVIELKSVNKVALFIGDGCKDASEEIMRFAEMINAPFVTGPMGKRWVNEKHPLYRGVFGFGGNESAKDLLQDKDDELDLVIAIGAALGELGTRGWAQELINKKLVHVDSRVEHFTRSHMARLHVCGHLPTIFRIINEKLNRAQRYWNKEWDGLPQPAKTNINGCATSLINEEMCLSDAHPIKPQRLFTHLSRELPQDTRVFVDAGNAWAWSIQYYQRSEHDGKYHIAMGLGAMAWAIGAVVGSAAGNARKHPHLCITGDGSYLMSAQEITVAKQMELPVVYVILNDAVLGMVMHGQRLGGAAETGFDLGVIDYAMMAESMGIEGVVVNTVEELEAIDYQRLFSKNSPTLIDVRIDKEEIPPMTDRVKGIAVNGESATPGG
ncbi:MAG: thiamine pyrophosphate-binding protein [Alteromonadaceae bacterium]|nr:thiamine pyrophosphate-binding protein [Alteromonadaceae bacterium]